MRIFGNLAYVASVSARVRGECWDESKKEKWTELSFLLLSLQLSCDHSNGNACFAGYVWIISTYTEALYLHRGYAMAMLMTCFQFFFYLQKRLCHSIPRRRFLGEAFFLPPGNDGAFTPKPSPLRNVTFSFCRCQKGRIIKHFNLQIFYVSVLIYHYEPAWNTTISRYKTLPLSFKDL